MRLIPFLLMLTVFSLACSLTTQPISSKNASPLQLLPTSTIVVETISPTPTPLTTCTVTAQTLHLRNCAGPQCTVIGWLSQHDVLTVEDHEADWIQVTTPAGQSGWVHSKYCGGLP